MKKRKSSRWSNYEAEKQRLQNGINTDKIRSSDSRALQENADLREMRELAWLEFHQTMPTHRKTLRLARALNVTKFEAIGIMCCLWCWALDNATKDGLITGADAQDIADAVGYTGDPDGFVFALISSGYLEQEGGGFRLHDWYDYAGKLISRREANKLYMRNARAKNAKETNVNCTDSACATRGNHVVTTCAKSRDLPYRTLPNNISSGSLCIDESEKANAVPSIGEDRDQDEVIRKVISYLNEKAGTAFRPSSKATRGLINGRIADGYNLEDFKRVIDDRCRRWKGKEQEQYLRPSTLFSPTNFENYVQSAPKEQQQETEYFQSDFDVFEGKE